jgi:hypothetical protein
MGVGYGISFPLIVDCVIVAISALTTDGGRTGQKDLCTHHVEAVRRSDVTSGRECGLPGVARSELALLLGFVEMTLRVISRHCWRPYHLSRIDDPLRLLED